jgi:hypothetical protein
MAQKFERRSFIKATSTIALGLGAFRTGLASSNKNQGLKSKGELSITSKGELSYKILYNQDDTALFYTTKEPIEPRHVDQMVDECADNGVDLFIACCNNQKVNYQSQVWEPLWDEYREHGTVFGGSKNPKYIAMVKQMMRLSDMGCDYLAQALKRSRERGIAFGIGIRMDDFHFRGPVKLGEHLVNKRLAAFYRNPENYLVDTGRVGGNWALNYDRPEVREYFLSLIREIIERHDIDVLDLDFMRHPVFFDKQDMDRHYETMTEFLREIHRIFKINNRKTSISVRVPATPANCRELGLDVGTWAREGLVSGIAPALKGTTGWETRIEEFRQSVGTKVSIFAALERSADNTSWLDEGSNASTRTKDKHLDDRRSSRWTRETLRGFAAGQLANGAEGIYFFNFFATSRPLIDVLAELKSLEELRGKKKTYLITTYDTSRNGETDLPMQVPVTVPVQQSRRFEMMMAAEPGAQEVEAQVILDCKAEPGDLWLQLNDVPLGNAKKILGRAEKDKSFYSWWNRDVPEDLSAAVFNVPAKAIRDGRNYLVFRNNGKPVQVLGLAVSINDIK